MPRAATNRATGLPGAQAGGSTVVDVEVLGSLQLVRSLSIRSFVVRLGKRGGEHCLLVHSFAREFGDDATAWRITRTRWASPSTSSKSEDDDDDAHSDAAISVKRS